MRRTTIVTAAAVLSLLVSVACHQHASAESVVNGTESGPAARLLRAIASGSVDAKHVTRAIVECEDMHGKDGEDCRLMLEAVLSEFAASSEAARALVAAGIDGDLEKRRDASRWKTALGRIRPNGAVEVGAGLPMAARYEALVAQAHGVGERDAELDRGRIRTDVVEARIGVAVTKLLAADPEHSLERALSTALSKNCDDVYEGSFSALCGRVGLWAVQRVSLKLAVSVLDECRGDDRTVRRILDIKRPVLAAAVALGEGSSDSYLARRTALLRVWMDSSPKSRWEAWAAIEEWLGPRTLAAPIPVDSVR